MGFLVTMATALLQTAVTRRLPAPKEPETGGTPLSVEQGVHYDAALKMLQMYKP
jgi:hypothetical protein